MFLPNNTFQTIIESTPLISIDLLIKNSQGQFLLGFRNNKPAQGYWFVPGGRILKDESIENSFIRLLKDELGVSASIKDAQFSGVYQHFYSDNVFGYDVTTHYVVLAYKLELDIDLSDLPDVQHSDYQWFNTDELLSSNDVHKHTKWYLQPTC
jgi:colanic acid biosynthesis protein WcaH